MRVTPHYEFVGSRIGGCGLWKAFDDFLRSCLVSSNDDDMGVAVPPTSEGLGQSSSNARSSAYEHSDWRAFEVGY